MTENSSWDETITALPGAHFLQTKEWAEVKSSVGWSREELTWSNPAGKVISAAQLLVRSQRISPLGPRVSIGYIPRGPLLDWSDPHHRQKVLAEIERKARQKKLVFVKIDPEIKVDPVDNTPPDGDIPSGDEITTELKSRGWKFSPEQIQFKNTMLLDLSGSEESWLARMKQKTRYNIRLAQKSSLKVRKAKLDDLPLLYKMYAETANRDGFIIRPESYYFDVWTTFFQAGMGEGLIAEFDGMPIAGLVFFYIGATAWYIYGMSTILHREKMPNYLLQWEAMRSAKEKGCEKYDLWGAPDIFEPTDPMYGVYRFKEGLGAEVMRTVGAWDYPVRPLFYFLYHRVIPLILSVTRSIRRKQIQQEVL